MTSSVVSPSAAVTETVTVFSPGSKASLPETVNEAKGSVVTATTTAARVPAGNSTEPPEASKPPTVTEANVVSTPAATIKINR